MSSQSNNTLDGYIYQKHTKEIVLNVKIQDYIIILSPVSRVCYLITHQCYLFGKGGGYDFVSLVLFVCWLVWLVCVV